MALAILIPGHLFAWAVEWAFIGIILVFGITALFRRKRGLLFDAFSSEVAGIVCLALTSLWALAYLYTLLRGHTETGIRDYLEGLRYVICFLFLLDIGTKFRKTTLRAFHVGLHVSLVWSFVCGCAYAVNIPGLTWLVQNVLYADVKTSIDMADGYYRLSIPFENPNFLGFYLILVLSYFLFFYRGITRIPVVLLTLGLLFATGSRSAWAATAVVLAIFPVAAFRDARKSSQVVLLGCLLVGGAVIWAKYSDAILSSGRVLLVTRAADEGGVMTEGSAEGRVAMVEKAYDLLQESPIIGWGSYKYGGLELIDNQIVTWLFRLGAIGCGIILIGFGRVVARQVGAAGRAGSTAGVVAFWGGTLVMLMTGAFLDNFRLFYIFWCFVAAVRLNIASMEHPIRPARGAHGVWLPLDAGISAKNS
jgi:hypothetical protein